jgi:hypothetical protein
MEGASPHLIFECFKLLGWLFPPPPLDEESIAHPEVLLEKGKKWNFYSGVVCLGLLAVVSALLGYLAILAAAWRLSHLGKTVFLIDASPVELCIWAVFLAMAATPVVGLLVLRIALGRQLYADYIMVLSHTSPLGGEAGIPVHVGKVCWFLFLLLSPILLLWIAARIDSYTAFTEDAMIVNSMWSFGREQVRPYQNVRGIFAVDGYHARFEDVHKPRHVLVFKDGTRWTTGDDMRAPRPDTDAIFIDHIARKSGQPVMNLPFLEDVPK